MNTTLVNALLGVGVAVAVTGGMTFALFADTETSEKNALHAGRFDVEIVPSDSPTVGWKFDIADMKPGDKYENMTLDFKKLFADEVAWSLDHVEILVTSHGFVDGTHESGGVNTAAEFLSQIRVDRAKWEDGAGPGTLVDCLDASADGVSDFKSVQDLILYGVFDHDDGASGPGASTCESALNKLVMNNSGEFILSISMPQDLPDVNDNRYQGDRILLDFQFGFAQDPGQDVLSVV